MFETSDKRIHSFYDFTRDITSRWDSSKIIGRKPVSEFIGPDLDGISFSIDLHGQFGVRPRVEMEKWNRMSRSGQVEILVIGKRALGLDRWYVSDVSEKWNVVMDKGELLSCSVEVSLKEYIGEL